MVRHLSLRVLGWPVVRNVRATGRENDVYPASRIVTITLALVGGLV